MPLTERRPEGMDDAPKVGGWHSAPRGETASQAAQRQPTADLQCVSRDDFSGTYNIIHASWKARAALRPLRKKESKASGFVDALRQYEGVAGRVDTVVDAWQRLNKLNEYGALVRVGGVRPGVSCNTSLLRLAKRVHWQPHNASDWNMVRLSGVTFEGDVGARLVNHSYIVAH